MTHLAWILTVLTGLLVAGQIGANNSTSESSSSISWPSRWWTKSEKTTSRRSELLQQKLERDRVAWLTRNGEKNVEEEIIINLTKHVHNKNETEASLSLLENIVTPEEEILDELNDRQIIQAVVTSMAQWNLRKLQKIQRRKDEGNRRSRRDEAMVCYNELGCFRDEGPFNYLDLLPAPPEEINTRFLLYTPRNRDVSHVLAYHNATSILASPYNASLPTKVTIHGFGGSCQRIWAKEMRTALVSVGDVNVICVDWENGANLPNYVRAAVNTRLVGRQVALLINAINSLTGSTNADFHLIGFSLGAHVAGFAGSDLRNLSRITGLDPAGPLFENYDPRARLDSTDANLVDVIHSNGEKIYMGGLGAWAPMGDIDFYPNGGRMQKGCTNLFVGAVSDMIWSTSEENGRSLCNHRRAYKLFTDSVVPGCHFPAFTCESYEKLLEGDCFPCVDAERCSNMGYYADRSAGRGVMYLATREEEPFCANQYRVQLQSAVTLQPISTQGKIELVLIGNNNFNETFTLTKGPDFELTSGGKLVRLIVPHPTFSPPTKVLVVYTAYHGWIYNGLPKWPIEKLVLTDSFGKSMSYCHQKGLFLDSSKGIPITLHPGECNPPPPPPPPQLTNSLINNPNTLPFHNRPALELTPQDNEIAVLDPHSGGVRFRSLMDSSNATAGLFEGTESRSARSNISASSSNIFPYGNVPLSLLQQQIPADIKVGSNNGTPGKRPSFYQWPLVGASQAANFFFGGNGRPRFKSLGSRSRSYYEPQGQLTPPSLQQLQQQGSSSTAVISSSGKEGSPRRPYFRRNHAQQQQMSQEERQSRQEYYLLRQQQLVLQQQQFNQANRFRMFNQQLQQQHQSPAAPSQWVVAPKPAVVPNQWRPDAAVEAEVPRFQQVASPPIRPSSTTQDMLPSSISTSVISPISPVTTLTTMTILNTRLPDLEADSGGADSPSDGTVSTLLDNNNDDPNLLTAVEAANVLSAKTPSTVRGPSGPMNDTSIPTSDVNNTSSSPSGQSPSVGGSQPNIWPSEFGFVSDVGGSTSSLSEEIYPDPEQLGQVRDEYWSSKSAVTRGRGFASLPTGVGLPIQQYPMVIRPSSSGGSNGAVFLFDHKPTYIPINPADRQSRQLQAQYYADPSVLKTAEIGINNNNHPVARPT